MRKMPRSYVAGQFSVLSLSWDMEAEDPSECSCWYDDTVYLTILTESWRTGNGWPCLMSQGSSCFNLMVDLACGSVLNKASCMLVVALKRYWVSTSQWSDLLFTLKFMVIAMLHCFEAISTHSWNPRIPTKMDYSSSTLPCVIWPELHQIGKYFVSFRRIVRPPRWYKPNWTFMNPSGEVYLHARSFTY